MEELLRETAKSLFRDKKVDLVLGFGESTLPGRTTPVFIESEEECDRLVWNRYCQNNLSVYLKKLSSAKVGIVAKGCDTRSILVLIQENQVKRENVIIIGMPCSGMVDPAASTEAEHLYDMCRQCTTRNPVEYDVLIGEKVEELEDMDGFSDARDFQQRDASERWTYFEKEMEKCIRCNACRNACPLCYCDKCVLDSTDPRWTSQTSSLVDKEFYHIIRIFHQAGRCVDCGACVRACPMGVDLRTFLSKLRLDAKELFDYRAGTGISQVPLLLDFREDDHEDFI